MATKHTAQLNKKDSLGPHAEMARILEIAASDPNSTLSREALTAIYEGVAASDFSRMLRAEAAKTNRGVAFMERCAGSFGTESIEPTNRGAAYAAKKAANKQS